MTIDSASAHTLETLARVGPDEVIIRLNPRLYAPELVRQCARPYADLVSVDEAGRVRFAAAGQSARATLRGFLTDLTAAVLQP